MSETTISEAPVDPRPASSRWMGVGRSESADPGVAGSAAADQALAGRSPVVVLVFCAHTYDIPALLAPIRARLAPEAVLVGCSTNGHFGLPAPISQDVDAGVVVLALGGEGIEASAAVQREVSARRREAGAEVSRVVEELSLEHRVCLLLADGLTREQHEIVRGSYATLGALVPTVGGCSGDDITYTKTYQFIASRDHVEVLSDGLVGLAIGSSGPIGVGLSHGWSKFGQPLLVTSSSGGRVYELDNRPALDVYLECLGLSRHDALDETLFRETAFHHPLGLSRRTGEDIRVVHAADVTDGSLLCLADVPQGAIAWQMSTNMDDLVSAAENSRDQAVDGLDGEPPIGLVVFDCGARKSMLGPDGVVDELQALSQGRETPLGGFYTYGEIARTHGARGMHHLTLVTLALS
jgi:hypothetical protein